jgi:hypothetical protein
MSKGLTVGLHDRPRKFARFIADHRVHAIVLVEPGATFGPRCGQASARRLSSVIEQVTCWNCLRILAKVRAEGRDDETA